MDTSLENHIKTNGIMETQNGKQLGGVRHARNQTEVLLNDSSTQFIFNNDEMTYSSKITYFIKCLIDIEVILHLTKVL